MKRYLADVNVWFALAVGEHRHHQEARAWWDAAEGMVGFVRTTQLGLLRLLTTAGALGGKPLSNAEAWAVYDGFVADARVRVFADPPALDERFRGFSAVAQPAPKIWANAYLAALAAAHEATLVTFDRAFAGYGIACRILGEGGA